MWESLSNSQKEDYKNYCESKFGKTFIFCETGEPLFMNEEGELIDTIIIIKLLFKNNLN